MDRDVGRVGSVWEDNKGNFTYHEQVGDVVGDGVRRKWGKDKDSFRRSKRFRDYSRFEEGTLEGSTGKEEFKNERGDRDRDPSHLVLGST